jgi:hypothetical protein
MVIICIILCFGGNTEDSVNEEIQNKLEYFYKNDMVLSQYVNTRIELIKKALEKNIVISNSDGKLINIAYASINRLKKPLMRFEAIMNLVDGERFMAQEDMYKNKDYAWHLGVCNEYIDASNDLLQTYSDLLLFVNDEINTCDVFDHKKLIFLEEFSKIYYAICHAPIELYKQHIEMGRICKQTIELLKENDGKWIIKKNGDLFFNERSVVIELNDLIQIMDEINYKLIEFSEKVDKVL